MTSQLFLFFSRPPRRRRFVYCQQLLQQHFYSLLEPLAIFFLKAAMKSKFELLVVQNVLHKYTMGSNPPAHSIAHCDRSKRSKVIIALSKTCCLFCRINI